MMLLISGRGDTPGTLRAARGGLAVPERDWVFPDFLLMGFVLDLA
jgi:hypothetical protein